MGRNETEIVDTALAKVRLIALRIADQIPLPLHFVFNAVVLAAFLFSWVWPADPMPFLDELLTAATVYYYNVYLLKRTFGALNPVRIFRGESPVAKRRLGLLPYDQYMERIQARLKAMRKAAREAGIPGLSGPKVDQLARQVKEIEKRLRLLDRLLIRPEFQEGAVRAQLATLRARLETVDQESLKEEFARAVEQGRQHLENIQRLLEERNRLVARLERFSLQLDQSFSRLVAAGAYGQEQIAEAERQFDELFAAINAFEETLQELEAKPSSDLYEAAVREVAETEAKFKLRPSLREPARKL